jgi:hypothetical protein
MLVCLLSRFVRLGVPTIELDAQGRSRPSICSLYNWRYRALGNLPHVLNHPDYQAGLPIKNPPKKNHLKWVFGVFWVFFKFLFFMKIIQTFLFETVF